MNEKKGKINEEWKQKRKEKRDENENAKSINDERLSAVNAAFAITKQSFVQCIPDDIYTDDGLQITGTVFQNSNRNRT